MAIESTGSSVAVAGMFLRPLGIMKAEWSLPNGRPADFSCGIS